jgi:endo-1,4-beta-xylanase
VSDGSKTPLVKDLSFIDAAFGTAYKVAAPYTRLSYNDYSTGGNDNKTACVFQLIEYINKNVGVPYDRLAVGFQSHVTARPYWFPSKSDLAANFAKLAGMGVDAYITELDIQVISNATVDARYQAAIWGDYLDTCLHASNCHEFLNWDTRDDESWITSGFPTLFDTTGTPKLAAYEVQARFQRYITGKDELCATSAGTAACKVTS